MYCHKCGALNDDNAAVCGKCGAAVEKASLDVTTPTPEDQPAVQYAGFWRRLGASLIDILILQTVTMIPFVLLIPVGILTNFSDTANTVYRVVCVIVWVVLAVLQLLYWPWMESSSRQATLGKRAVGIVVTDIDGRRISFVRATGRNLAKIVSAIIYYVGFIMIAFTKKKQGLHDMMASCVVVVKKK